MPNVSLNVHGTSLKEIVKNLRDASFAMAYATLRERYTQHDKTGSLDLLQNCFCGIIDIFRFYVFLVFFVIANSNISV
jgi:hypothetical protein